MKHGATVRLICAVVLSGWAAGDEVARFAEAAPGSGASIAIPGFDVLTFQAGQTAQAVNLQNPAQNACAFVMTLSLEGGEVLWTGEALSPGQAFTRINLLRALEPGQYPATLHYECYTLNDQTPLNGAETQLTLEAK